MVRPILCYNLNVTLEINTLTQLRFAMLGNNNPEGHSSALFLDFQVFSYRAPLTAQSAVIGYFKSRRPELIHIAIPPIYLHWDFRNF